MPLPFALDHINLWVLDDEIDGHTGYTLIDCGITSNATKHAWEQLFDGSFAGKPLLRVICTHFHPDHFGLAHWLTAGGDRQRWTVRLWMTATEYAFGRYLSAGGGDNISGDLAAQHFSRNGLSDGEALQQVRERGSGYYPSLVPAVPRSFHRIHDGDEIAIGHAHAKRIFRVIVGFGHAPEHASLYCEDDRLLRGRRHGAAAHIDQCQRVRPGARSRSAAALLSFARSIADAACRHAGAAVARQTVYRIASADRPAASHHAERLAEVLAACSAPQTAASIVPVLFKRQLDLHQMTFALGESLAHLHALWYEGKLDRKVDGGVYRFAAT